MSNVFSPAMIWSGIALGAWALFRDAIKSTLLKTWSDAVLYWNRRVNKDEDPAIGEFRLGRDPASGGRAPVCVEDRLWSWNRFGRLVLVWKRNPEGPGWFLDPIPYDVWADTQLSKALPKDMYQDVSKWRSEIEAEKAFLMKMGLWEMRKRPVPEGGENN